MIRALSFKITLRQSPEPDKRRGEIFVIYGDKQIGFPVSITSQEEIGGYLDIFLSANDTSQTVYLLGKLLTDTLKQEDMENAPNKS